MPVKVATAPARSSATSATAASSESGSSVTRKAPPETGGISATSSPSAQLPLALGVLAVDRVEQAGGLVAEAERGPHVGEPVDAVELALRPARPLAQAREEANADHGVSVLDKVRRIRHRYGETALS